MCHRVDSTAAAMSASSASTTIRSAFPFTLSPTVNCHDIFGPRAKLSYERALTGMILAASSVFVPRVLLLVAYVDELVVRRPVPRIQCAKENGADAGLMGITCYMIRPTARFIYWHQSTMARPSQMAIRSPQHKCPNERQRAAIRGDQRAVVSPQLAPSRLTKAEPCCPLSSAKKTFL